jgi:signal transduction histidine kinase
VPAPAPHETVSETGAKVLSSHYRIARTGWVVVAEEPLGSVYARVNNDVKVALGFFALSAALGLGLMMFSVRNLMAPIRALTQGAARLASGDLNFRIGLRRRDEFGLLAQTFDAMAAKISADITKLQEVDQLKSEFIMIASHNLRTPLTVINGYVDMMQDEEIPPKLREMVTAIEASARELSGFSEDMLTIATIEAGKATLRVADVTVAELLEPLRAEFGKLAAKKDVAMRWEAPTATTKLHLSPSHIRSAVGNLLGNALEFTPKGGEVALKLAVGPGQCVITVRDTGSGIAVGELGRLFTKFHRGTSTYQYDHPGTGIGLYATRLIVEAHRGRIEVQSEVGKGTVFTITLPTKVRGSA